MSGHAIGADPDALDEVASVMRRLAAELDRRPQWSPHRTGASWGAVSWNGVDAERLRNGLRAVELERRRAATGLLECARGLAAAAVQQRRASSEVPVAAVTVDSAADGGRLVQRIGGAGAPVVVLVVPGVGTDRGDRDRLRADATRVWRDLADRVDDPSGFAVLSWLGYDPPDRLLGALDIRPAEEGARLLTGEVLRLRRSGATRVVVVGHSYGGVVAGRAVAAGMDADVVVQLGSPGSGAVGAAAAMRTRGIELRAVREPGDPIGFVAGRLPGLYGEDPVGEAPSLRTSGSGHGAYLSDPVLLDGLAELVLRYRRDP